jgi:signal peptidase I
LARKRPRSTRARREALRFARQTLALLARHRKRVGEEPGREIEAAVREVQEAAAGEDRERLSGALLRLDGLWEKHLAFARKAAWREYAEAVGVAVAAALFLRAFLVEPYRIPTSSMAPTLLEGDHVLVDKLVFGPRVPFASRRFFDLEPPRRGDVVVFESPREPGRDFVKRVVGVAGDVVEVRDQLLYVNGVPQPREAAGGFAYEERNESTGRWWRDTCLRFRERLAQGALARPADDSPQDREAAFAAAARDGVRVHDLVQCRHARFGDREGPFMTVAPGHLFVVGDNRDRSADSRSDGGWQVPIENVKGRAMRVWWSWGRGGFFPFAQSGLRAERLLKRIE